MSRYDTAVRDLQPDEYEKLGSYAMIGLPMEAYPTRCAVDGLSTLVISRSDVSHQIEGVTTTSVPPCQLVRHRIAAVALFSANIHPPSHLLLLSGWCSSCEIAQARRCFVPF